MFASLISIGVILLALAYRYSWFLFPAALLGKTTHSSIGWYFGAIVQIVIGAWLLGWLDKWIRKFDSYDSPSHHPLIGSRDATIPQ